MFKTLRNFIKVVWHDSKTKIAAAIIVPVVAGAVVGFIGLFFNFIGWVVFKISGENSQFAETFFKFENDIPSFWGFGYATSPIIASVGLLIVSLIVYLIVSTIIKFVRYLSLAYKVAKDM